MFTLATSTPELVEVPVETEATLGSTNGLEERDVRVSLGRPQVSALLPAQIGATDPDLARFVEDTEADFFFCQFWCSLAGSSRARLERATFRVLLDDVDKDAAVIWSMSPLRLTARSPQPVGGSVEIGFAPFLKLSGTWADDVDRERCYVLALGEGENDAEWRYTRQPDLHLDGAHHMSAVIRIPEGQTVVARLAISAVARRRRLGLFPFRAMLPPELRELVIGNPTKHDYS